MKQQNILIIGGGIGGLTAAIALGKYDHKLTVIERDPEWSVYGVGIIQQSNVVRAMQQLGILDDYLDVGYGYDGIEVYIPTGERVAQIPSPKLVEGKPANVGIGRPALHKVLGDRAKAAGAEIRLGVVADTIEELGDQVEVSFSDGKQEHFDLVIAADGVYSSTRKMYFPEAAKPEFTGQSVWRYNFQRPEDVTCLHAYEGRIGLGLVPLSDELMYMYVTTPEPDRDDYPIDGIATAMREKVPKIAPRIAELAEQIIDDAGVVYRPMDGMFVDTAWHKGRVVMLGDAVHATTPHLGQGAGMAIEDAIVLAEEIDRADTATDAFTTYQSRRHDRCKYIVNASLAICRGQLGLAPAPDQATASMEMFQETAKPI